MRATHPAKNFDEVLGARRSLARISDVFGKVAPKTSTALIGAPTMSGFFKNINESRPTDVPDHVGTLIGAAVGGFALRSAHPVLGVIGGASIGRNLPALFRDDVRKLAMRNLLTTGGGVVGSIYMPKHPIVGFFLGAVAGGAAAYVGGLK
jgi:hypothetical protein